MTGGFHMNWNAAWIKPQNDLGDIVPAFSKCFRLNEPIKKATLHITALGVYEATLNGQRVGEFIMAPGWTAYDKRLQYQEYDITDILLSGENELQVLVGKGWYRSPLATFKELIYQETLRKNPAGLLAQLTITLKNDQTLSIGTDDSWSVAESNVRFSEIYDGEIYDASVVLDFSEKATCFDGPWNTLIPQQGEEVREQEYITPARMFTTPKGEVVIDFGQELTGYVKTTVTSSEKEIVDLSFAEVMDQNGNFYTENYRTAKAQYHYICKDGTQTYCPKLTFWGFRYIRINAFPGGIDKASLENFTAIVVHSEIKRTGHLKCSDPLLNRLFENVIWGQKGNFLDVPTDCPQRNERLGWTGDAQVFIRTACLNYDVEKFFTKWLADMSAHQRENGYVGTVIPDLIQDAKLGAAWSDAATICPWELYLAYGNPQILISQFQCMRKWVDYVTGVTTTPYLWTGGIQFADWLGLDAPTGSYKGSSRDDFVASAFYAHSTELLIKAGNVLGEDMSSYEVLYENIVDTFQKTYRTYETQTECVLAAHFHLAPDCQAAADQLAQMVIDCGNHLMTGFVGTPYLLHVLSDYGHADLSYTLLLRKEYPSWLYSVTKGATTIWEHWDGIMEDGSFWSAEMNSFNHYAYGSVADWVYTKAAGIQFVESAPGYEKVLIAPIPDDRLDWLEASLATRHGTISSKWTKENDCWRFEITTPVETQIVLGDQHHQVSAGSYLFYQTL